MVWATPRPRSAEVWHDRATSSCSWATPPQWSASVQLHETDPVKLSSLWRCLTKIKLRMNGSSPALDEHLGICVFQSKGICWYCFKFNFQGKKSIHLTQNIDSGITVRWNVLRNNFVVNRCLITKLRQIVLRTGSG